jgi:uncharacterized protein (UPF0335 family)
MAKPKPEQQRPQDIAAKAKPFIDRIEYLEDELRQKREEIAESKKIVMEEAEASGVQPKALKAVLRRRKFERAEAEKLEKLDIDEKAQLSALADSLGDTPFGNYAREAANALQDVVMEMKDNGIEVTVSGALVDTRDIDHLVHP